MNSCVQSKGTLLCKCLQAGDALERSVAYRKKINKTNPDLFSKFSCFFLMMCKIGGLFANEDDVT